MSADSKPQRNHTNIWLVALAVGVIASLATAMLAESGSLGSRDWIRDMFGDAYEVSYGIPGVVLFILTAILLYQSKWFDKKAPAPLPPSTGVESDLPDTIGHHTMNTSLNVVFVYGLALIGNIGVAWGINDRAVDELIIPSAILAGLGVVALYIFVYRVWAAIQDGHARTTPGAAIGLLLVPFYNLYWLFQVLPGWGEDYNALLQRYAPSAKPVDVKLLKFYSVSLFIPMVNVFTFAILMPQIIVQMTRGVNQLHEVRRARG